MKGPVIGISCSQNTAEEIYYIRNYYSRAVELCGGVPILLPIVEKEDTIKSHVDYVSGLILSGGVDIAPGYFSGEPLTGSGRITPERDRYEVSLIKKFITTKKPVLAICRGMQILNIACGGFIYQDIHGELKRPLVKHMQEAPKWYPSHTVDVEPGTILYKIYRQTKVAVNSFHHQAVSITAPHFKVAARSSDGIIEAIEHEKLPFVVGVQWHPECLALKKHLDLTLFKKFVEMCKKS